MQRGDLDDLLAFLAVGSERSFTKAAAQLGLSQSSLSHLIRELEARLGVRLLTRTTRSVSPTDAGERLLQHRRSPHGRDWRRACGLERLSRQAGRNHSYLGLRAWCKRGPAAQARGSSCPHYPDIKVEVVVDNGLIDIVAERYDAGARRGGELWRRDMIAVRIGPDLRMAVVGSPAYFRKRPEPKKPQDLIGP